MRYTQKSSNSVPLILHFTKNEKIYEKWRKVYIEAHNMEDFWFQQVNGFFTPCSLMASTLAIFNPLWVFCAATSKSKFYNIVLGPCNELKAYDFKENFLVILCSIFFFFNLSFLNVGVIVFFNNKVATLILWKLNNNDVKIFGFTSVGILLSSFFVIHVV